MKHQDPRGMTPANSIEIQVGPRGDFKWGHTTRRLQAFIDRIKVARDLYRRGQAPEFYRSLYAAARSGRIDQWDVEHAVELSMPTIIRKLKKKSPITEEMFVFQYCLVHHHGYWVEENPTGEETMIFHLKTHHRGIE